jgi:hypothetical protein
MRRLLLAAVVGLALGAGPAAAAPANPLASLVVPRPQLGKQAQGLEVELQSGATSNARAADDSFDPGDTEATVTKAGRVSGYTLLYGDVSFTALRKGSGLIDLGTSLDIFKTPQEAAAYELKSLRDLRRVQTTRTNLSGVVVVGAAPFAVSGLGPSAIGLRITQRVGTKRIYSTFVDFQIDKILCEAVVNRADRQNVDLQAVAVARKLAGRIIAYAQGRLNATPVPLPRPLGTAMPPGRKAPDLSKMVPTNQDMKGKAGVSQQAFSPDDLAIGSYIREFRFGPNAGIFQLRATAALQRSRREVAGRLYVLRSIFTGPDGASTLAQVIGGTSGAAKLDPIRQPRLGEESFAVSATFKLRGQVLRAVVVYERRDRVLGSLIVIGTAKRLTLAQVTPWARILDRRIKSGLKPALVA